MTPSPVETARYLTTRGVTLTRLAGDAPPFAVRDGDTICCGCSVAHAAAGECHRAWTAPGDLVVDMYAGRAPLARACLHEGRRYIGAELDPGRHADALVALAEYRMREGL